MRILNIPKQKKISPFWGGLKDLLSRTMFYVAIINFMLIVIMSYHTSLKEIIQIPFWIFILILTICLFIIMIFEYMIMLPSSTAFSNIQSYKHENPIKEDLKNILKKIEVIEEHLKNKNNK